MSHRNGCALRRRYGHADTRAPFRSFEEASAERDRLEQEVSTTGSVMATFPQGAMGLIPDHVKATLAWREANARFRRAFKALQDFNIVFTRVFAKELRAQRDARRGGK